MQTECALYSKLLHSRCSEESLWNGWGRWRPASSLSQIRAHPSSAGSLLLQETESQSWLLEEVAIALGLCCSYTVSEPQLASGSPSSCLWTRMLSCKTLIRFVAHVYPVPGMVLGTRKVLTEPYFPRHRSTGLLSSFEISLSNHLSNQPRPGAVK